MIPAYTTMRVCPINKVVAKSVIRIFGKVAVYVRNFSEYPVLHGLDKSCWEYEWLGEWGSHSSMFLP